MSAHTFGIVGDQAWIITGCRTVARSSVTRSGSAALAEVLVAATEEVVRLADRRRHHPLAGCPGGRDRGDRGDDVVVVAGIGQVGQPGRRDTEVQQVRMGVDQPGHDPRAVEIDGLVDRAERGADVGGRADGDDSTVARRAASRAPHRRSRRGSDRRGTASSASTLRRARGCVTTPAVPSTSIRSPVRISFVAAPVAHTAGMRYSRDTIAVCDSAPPVSHTQPAIWANAGVQFGDVKTHTRISSGSRSPRSVTSTITRARPRATPDDAGTPVSDRRVGSRRCRPSPGAADRHRRSPS